MKRFFYHYSFRSMVRLISLLIIVLSASLLFFYASKTLPYQLISISISGNNWITFFHDFDKDGLSEQIALLYDQEHRTGHVIVQRHNGSAINEWKIPGYVAFSSIYYKRWIEMGDINNDNYDDIVLFSQQNDSLFLYAIDVKNSEKNTGKFIIKRSFLLQRKKNNNNIWHIFFNHHAIVDLNNDGQRELVFTLVSSDTLSPRGIYIYDFKQKKLTHRYDTRAALMQMDFFDLNDDGTKEIIVGTYAGGNYAPQAFQSDFYSWIFVFDHTLKPFFKPIKLYDFTSSFTGMGVKIGTKNYIIGFIGDTGKTNECPKLIKITPDGKIIKSIEIPEPQKWDAKFFRINSDSIMIYARNRSKKIRIYSRKLKLLKIINLNKSIQLKTMNDLNNDGKMEIIATDPFNLFVFDSYLNLLAKANTRLKNMDIVISVGENGPSVNKDILMSNETFEGLYHFSRVPLFKSHRFVFFFLLWILLVLFLLYFDSKGISKLIKWNTLNVIEKASKNGWMIINDVGKILFYNTNFLSFVGIKEILKPKTHFSTVMSDQKELVDAIKQAINIQKPLNKKINLNSDRAVLSILPIRTKIGIIIGYWIEIIKEREECLDKKIEIWANTIKKLAHDIKTPLSNIEVGMRSVRDSLMQTKLKEKGLLIEDLNILSNEVKRITSVVSSFLKFVNLEKPNIILSDIHQCIKKSVSHFEAYWNNNFTIEFEFDPNLPQFYFDPQQMEMVFNNLIKNALDALQQQGKIIIRTAFITDEIGSKEQHYCEIEVTDNGAGIPKEKQMFIFEPNFSEKENGTGLGLTIVKKIIEDHEGEIKVFSSPGLGTTFRIVIPLNIEKNKEN